MKRIEAFRCILAALVSGAMLMSSCQDNMDLADFSEIGTDLVFYVGHENNIDTRTALASDGFNVDFQDGDAIAIFDGTATRIKYSTSSPIPDSEATFTKESGPDPVESDAYYALYPYSDDATMTAGKITATISAEQYAPKGSFDPKANVSVAKAAKIGVTDLGGGQKQAQYRVTFLNVGNLVKFHFNEDSNVTAIVIRCNANQKLVGTVSIDPTTGNFDAGSIFNGSTTVTLKPSGSTTFLEGDYYAVLLPQTHESGISVKMEHSEGSYHFKRGGVTNLEMKRNKIYQLYSGDINKYTDVGMLPSLYKQKEELKTATTRISFHAMAQDVDWNYANANNILTGLIDGSDVRGYLEGGTLHIWTKHGMFGLPEEKILTGTNGIQLFNNYSNITAIDNLNYIDVSFIRDFYQMFYKCDKLTSIDISEWDTSSATNMKSMFQTSPSSKLEYIIFGDYFHLVTDASGQSHNMFASADASRSSNKIKVYAPSSVYNQFNGYYLYTNQLDWDGTTSEKYFGRFLNPTIVSTSVGQEVNFTFTIGGYINASMLDGIQVGFDGYTPTDLTLFESTGVQVDLDDGITYNMYALHLTSEQKREQRVITKVIADNSANSETHYKLVSSDPKNFPTSKSTSCIYANTYSCDVRWAENGIDGSASGNFISELNADNWRNYSGKNWPIVGQGCRITFYLKAADGYDIKDVFLSDGINNPVKCTYNSSAPNVPAGYKAYISDYFVAGNDCEEKRFTVSTNYVESNPTFGRLYPSDTKVLVKVYGITLGTGITTVSAFSNSTYVNTSGVYVIKSNTSGRFLYTNDETNTSTVKTKAQDIPDNYCFWKFNPATSPIKLETYNTQPQRYLTSGNQVSDRSGNAVSLTVSDGLKFANGSKYLFEATVNSESPTATSFSTTAGQNEWTVYPVTFSDPTAAQ